MNDLYRSCAVVLVLGIITPFANAQILAPPKAPVVAGHQFLLQAKSTTPAQRGELLLGELNCMSCHSAPKAVRDRIPTKAAPDLSNAGARLTPQYIRQLINNPQKTKPGTTMPHRFHASGAQRTAGVADFLTHYLVSLGGPIKPSKAGGSKVLVAQGRRLYHSVGCVACHAPEKKINTKTPIVPLPNLATKTTVDQLALFLADPLKVRPSGRMPHVKLDGDEAKAIAVYLLRDQLNNPQSAAAKPATSPGVTFELYTNIGGRMPNFDSAKPFAKGKAKTFTINVKERKVGDQFAFRFKAAINIPATGKYTFYTSSDDGSNLYIGGKHVVNNGGVHGVTQKSGSITLQKGEHEIVVTFFEAAGGEELRVEWEGPGVKKQIIPTSVLSSIGGAPMVPLNTENFRVEGRKASFGKRMFGVLGCASCHLMPNVGPIPSRAPMLTALNPESDSGCLSLKPGTSAPNYYLDKSQRDDIKAALKNKPALSKPASPKQQVQHHLAALNCYACHTRDGIGGPDLPRNALFKPVNPKVDHGDEGRLPPPLTDAGLKLKPAALEKIINHGQLHIRPYMATRMPMFGSANTRALIKTLPLADKAPAAVEIPFDKAKIKDGRRLAGTSPNPKLGGLGCVQCHPVGGREALGIQSVDFATMYERLTLPWFKKFLKNPLAYRPGLRMPPLWPNGAVIVKDVAGGNADKQMEALYAYLSLGKSMPAPRGLGGPGVKGTELVPSGEPIVFRTFFTGVGPRAIAVGYPELLHVVFDAHTVRLAKAWRGKFFDAAGTWNGRAGQFRGPLGNDLIDLPAGPSFARLKTPTAPWPSGKERNLGGKFKGYTLDDNRSPTFIYVLDGITIEEHSAPDLRPGGAILSRKFKLTNLKGKLYFLAASGGSIKKLSKGAYLIDNKITVTLTKTPTPSIRKKGNVSQLIIPITATSSSFEIQLSW